MKHKSNIKDIVYKKYNKTLRIMKISTLLIFVSAFNLLAETGYSQDKEISLKLANTYTIENVISEIEKTTDYVFIYNEDVVPKLKKEAKVDINNRSLNEILNQLLEGTDLGYSFASKQITIYRDEFKKEQSGVGLTKPILVQQETKRTIKGQVVGIVGEPIIGANIMEKGTKNGTVTDYDGYFSLDVDNNAVLHISYIGYISQDVNTAGTTTFNIVLEEDTQSLEEVVVVGYGIQKKTRVVGSVSQVSGEVLRKAPSMNVTNVLAGRIPGLSVTQTTGNPTGSDAIMRIRGVSTYSESGSSPLIIIDGVQRSQFSNLDVEEIESITLLKDAVSTAIYGLQAANGIILITTKRGTESKPEMSYTGAVTINQNTRFPKFLNGPDYMEWYNKATEMDNDYRIYKELPLQQYYYTQEQIEAVRNGTNTNPLLGNTNWVEELLGDNSLSHQHSLNLRGGSKNLRYFATVGFSNQEGVVENTSSERYNARTNLDANLTKAISVSFDLSVRKHNNNTPGISPDDNAYLNPIFQAVRMHPNLPMYTPDGSYTGSPSGINYINPIAAVRESGYRKRISDEFQGNITFKIKVPGVEGLEVKFLTAYDKNVIENKEWRSPYILMGRSPGQTIGDFTPILQRVPETYELETKSFLRQSFAQRTRITTQPALSFIREFQDHAISLLALYEWSEYKTNNFQAGGSNFNLTSIQELSKRSTRPEDWVAPWGGSGTDIRAGYVGRAHYSYKNKYLLELVNRFDASIKFAPKNRWKAFPGLGLGWVVSGEDFFQKAQSHINHLKIKGSVGQSGNDGGIQPFSYLRTFLYSNNVNVIDGNPVAGIRTSNVPNEDLKWETTTSANLGLESVLWKGLLSIDFEVFYKVTKDILNNPAGLYPLSLGGYVPAAINYGKMDNKGFDLALNHRNQYKDFKYGATLNLNWARNKILRRDESSDLPAWQRTIGRSYGEKLGFIVDGMYQTWEEVENAYSPSGDGLAPGFFKYRDINGDGKITFEDDFTFIGRSNIPELTYGLNLDMQYKGFDLSIFFQGAALCDVALAGVYGGNNLGGVQPGTPDNTTFTEPFYDAGYGNSPYYLVENSWRPDNTNAEYPRLSTHNSLTTRHNAWPNSAWIRNGAYVRLKTMQIGYTLPQRMLSIFYLESIRLYVSGFNLLTWDSVKYMDPELPNVNNGFYPQQRMYSLGANLTF